MSTEPNNSAMNRKDIARLPMFVEKRNVVGEFVALIDHEWESRGLQLIAPRSRALPVNDIQEFMITDEQDAGPGKTVNHVLVVGFFEVRIGGVIAVGDKVLLRNKLLGELVGFDVTHMPNHMNVVARAEQLVRLEVKLGDEVTIGRAA